MRIADYRDFRGGLVTSDPSGILKENELTVAENVYWRKGIVKRGGLTQYSANSFTGTIRGGIRTNINDTFYSVIAVDDATQTTFFQGTSQTMSSISYTFTTGYDVSFAELNGNLVAVNGYDDPIVFDVGASGTWSAQTIDSTDERTLTSIDWWAGQYDADATQKYIDDTSDIQGDTTGTFQLVGTATNDGFWFTSAFTFNKLTLSGITASSTAAACTYEYYNTSATWGTLTMVTSATWGTTGDKTIEWDIPLDWERAPSGVAEGSVIPGRWTMRVRFTTPPASAIAATSAGMFHTQKLTEILGGEMPDHASVHGSRLWLSRDDSNIVNYSPPNVVTGWRDREAEYFLDGGKGVVSKIGYKGNLIVFKDNAMFAYIGDSFDNFVRRKISDKGISSPRSAAVVKSFLFRVCSDGIYAFNGSEDIKITSHIQTDFDDLTITDACGIEYNGEYWVAFPSNSIAYVMDPDTIRRDESGEFRISIWKMTSYRVDQFMKAIDSGDLGYFLGITNATSPYISRLENGAVDGTSTAIVWKAQSAYMFDSGYTRRYTRVRPVMGEVASNTVSYNLRLVSDDGDVESTQAFSVPAGDNKYQTYLTVPYEIDGHNFAVYAEGSASFSAVWYGFSIEYGTRRF